MGFQPQGTAAPFTPGVMYYPQQNYQTPMEPVQLKAAIKKQVEYYFSTNNLVRDTYLRGQMNTEGFIPISFILSFKRLSMLTRDATALTEACEGSTEVNPPFELLLCLAFVPSRTTSVYQ
jgi:la-related protein 1